VKRLGDRVSAIEACRAAAAAGPLGFVPTMGALHQGHLALVRRARDENASVAVSIFVNPLQFDDPSDLAHYPRSEQEDAELLASAGADLALVLTADEMYPPAFATRVVLDERLTGSFEGELRPGHFDGVATVVTKLLHLVAPASAYFGRKDFQQCAVVRRLVADLELPVRIVVCDTVRDRDGLALSSRNAQLGPADRRRGLALVHGLQAAELAFDGGERDTDRLAGAARAVIERELLSTPDYVAIVDEELALVNVARAGDALIVAARVGAVRLIDNHVLGARIGPFSG
jgi:pantoate--beta-alanine ligase